MKRMIAMVATALFILPWLVAANCPAPEKIYCSRTFGGLSCGADYPGWVGGGLTASDDSHVQRFKSITWYNVSLGKGSVRCWYVGDKGGAIVMHEGNFGNVSVPTAKPLYNVLWQAGVQVVDNIHYHTLTCNAGINICAFKYTG